jgi:hypothetical protein
MFWIKPSFKAFFFCSVYRETTRGYFLAKKVLTVSKPTEMIQKTYFKTKDHCKVKFSFQTDDAETVEILGLNSDWENAIAMKKKKDGSFSCDVSLPKESRHEFKYRVNTTEWLNDPTADTEHPNVYGGSNSVIFL